MSDGHMVYSFPAKKIFLNKFLFSLLLQIK